MLKKSSVIIITNIFEVNENFPIYYTSNNLTNNERIKSLNVYNIKDITLIKINNFIVNLDQYFNDILLNLTNTLSYNRYLSPLYDNFLKGFRILEILKKEPAIYLMVDSKEIDLWKCFLRENNIIVKVITSKNLNLSQFKIFIKEVISIIREYFLLRIISVRKEKPNLAQNIFIHWINEKNQSITNIINNSNYFGDFIKNYSQKHNISILGNILAKHLDFKEIIRNTNCNFIQEYVGFFDLIWAFFKSLSLLFCFEKKILFKKNDYTAIINHSLKKDFFTCLYWRNLLFYKAFLKITKSLNQETKIFYPFENQPWEKALLFAIKKNKSIKTYAYQFFPIAKNFLIYKFSKKIIQEKVLPNLVLTSDINTNDLFGQKKIATQTLGSVRFSWLLNYKPKENKKNKILVCLFLEEEEIINIVKQTIEIAKNINIDCIINHHPLLNIYTKDQIAELIKDSKNISLSSQKATDLLENTLILIYNSSSAFLEAALRGIPVMYMGINDIVNLDRFNGLGKVVNSPKEAIEFIVKIKNNDNYFDEYSKKVYDKANNIIISYNNN